VILVGLAIDQIAQSGLSSLSVIYYSAQLFRVSEESQRTCNLKYDRYKYENGQPDNYTAIPDLTLSAISE
ncbi:hypothetical protein, partial [Citrobacter freundii]|uniref:hypothetical protein n=1 Tax=Citrobacter freundii TaxID=546 RepID=UPI003AAA983E